MYTKFMDMHSGGNNKIKNYEYIYIESNSTQEAIDKFKQLFSEDPYDVTCECCGDNFSVSTYETLEEATKFEREFGSRKIALEDYIKTENVCVIVAESNTRNGLHAPPRFTPARHITTLGRR